MKYVKYFDDDQPSDKWPANAAAAVLMLRHAMNYDYTNRGEYWQGFSNQAILIACEMLIRHTYKKEKDYTVNMLEKY